MYRTIWLLFPIFCHHRHVPCTSIKSRHSMLLSGGQLF